LVVDSLGILLEVIFVPLGVLHNAVEHAKGVGSSVADSVEWSRSVISLLRRTDSLCPMVFDRTSYEGDVKHTKRAGTNTPALGVAS
jgi:hypothetical protein